MKVYEWTNQKFHAVFWYTVYYITFIFEYYTKAVVKRLMVYMH